MEWKDNEEEIDDAKNDRLLFSLGKLKGKNEKVEISNEAKKNIFEYSSKFVDGEVDSLIQLEYILASIGFIPEESYNVGIFQSLIEFITNVKANKDILIAALDLISSFSLNNSEKFADFISPDFVKLLLFCVHSNSYLISFFSFTTICNLATTTQEVCEMFLDHGLLTTIQVILDKSDESIPLLHRNEIEHCQVIELINNIMQYIDESLFPVLFGMLTSELLSTEEKRTKTCILEGILQFSEHYPNALIDMNVHVIILDLMTNEDLCGLASHVIYEIAKRIGISFLTNEENGIDFSSYVSFPFDNNDFDAAYYSSETMLMICKEKESSITSDMIAFFLEKATTSSYRIKLLAIRFICNIILTGINEEISQLLVDNDIIDIFVDILSAEIENEKQCEYFNEVTTITLILDAILHEGTNKPVFSDCIKGNEDLDLLLNDDTFIGKSYVSKSSEIHSIFFT